LDEGWRVGVFHLIGENEVVAEKGTGMGKRFLINYAYNFLRKNLRQTESV
jgi:KUP system potassium uptake protein